MVMKLTVLTHNGVLFFKIQLYDWYSVKKNVGFGLSMRHVARQTIAKEVDTYLAEVKLDGWVIRRSLNSLVV